MKDNNFNEGEIPPKQIFEVMKTNTYDNYYNYSYSSINKEYISSRKSLFSILQKITIKMGFKSQTFFLSAHYLDIIFIKKRRIYSKLNTLALACLCLSAKYCENDPIVPHLQYFIRIFNYIMGYKEIITISELKNAEVLVLKLLNYNLHYHTIYDFNLFFISHGILNIEQIKDLDNNNKKLSRNRNNAKILAINPSNSLLIKNILDKIYKKSRFYIDHFINNTKVCFKYNPLYITIYIMKKSIEEILNNEQNINNLSQKEKEEFYSKTNLYFKKIMLDFYKTDYETNEQYLAILVDDEFLEIFEIKEKSEQAPAPSADINIPKEEKKVINNNNVNNEINKKPNLTGTYFYNRFRKKLNNDNISNKNNEKKISTSRKENINKNNNDNNIELEKKEEDNLDINLNINELKNINWNNNNNINNRRNKYNNNNNTKSIYSIYSNNSKRQNKEEQSLPSNNNNYLIQSKYVIGTNNRDNNQRGDLFNSIKNSNSIRKNYLDNNYNLTYSVYTNRGNKISLNKNINPKTAKISPIKYEGTSIRNKYIHYKKLNMKLKDMTGNERTDYSNNANDNTNMNSNNINLNINSNTNNFNYNTIKNNDKKPYSKKFIFTNNENFSSTLNSLNRNGISSYNYSNNNNYNSELFRKKNNENNDINSIQKYNKIDINNKELISSKINTFYNRIRVRNRRNDNLIKSNDISEDLNNKIVPSLKFNKNEILTNSTGFRRRFYTNNNTINNTNTNNNISNDISAEIKNNIPLIIKDDNKKEIEPYNQTNINSINSNIFKRIQTNNFFRKKNKLLNINISNDNSNDIKEDNKVSTTRNFYRNNNLNKITVNTTRATENKNNGINKTFDEAKKTYALKDNAKSEEINLNTINNDSSKKGFQSIRLKYLNLKNKNLNNNNNTNNNNINESDNLNKNKQISENHSTTNINTSKNINIPRITFRNLNIKNRNNKIEDNSNKNDNSLSTRVSDIENKNKNKNVIAESSLYRFLNKTKNIFTRNNKEEESNTQKIIDKNINNNINNNVSNDKNNNFSLFKTHQNFYKPVNKINNISKINNQKEENHKNSLLNNTAYLRSIINRNKLTKENKNKPNAQSQKNPTIVINNNININNENKTNNINNEYIKYKNIYKRNNIPQLNVNNDIIPTNKDNININTTNKNVKTNVINTENNIGNTITNLFNRFHFYRKNIDKNNNNNFNNSSIINKNEKFHFFHKK